MSQQIAFHRLDVPDLVTIRWEDGPVSVIVKQGWEQLAEPMDLLDHVRDELAGYVLEAPGHDWRTHVDLKRVPLRHVGEFNELFAEARAEDRAEPKLAAVEVRGRHLVGLWRRGRLLQITGDVDWLVGATRQEISDELVRVITPPGDEVPAPTVARDRFVRFMAEVSHG